MNMVPLAAPLSIRSHSHINSMLGMAASDIDKYSRIVFPVTFFCFQLMYWVIYDHLAQVYIDDLVLLNN